jgi:hypothetical protein
LLECHDDRNRDGHPTSSFDKHQEEDQRQEEEEEVAPVVAT